MARKLKEPKKSNWEVGTYNNETGECIVGALPPREKMRENIEKSFEPFNVRATVTDLKRNTEQAVI